MRNIKIRLGLLVLLALVVAAGRAHATPVCDSVPGNLIQNCGFEIFDHTLSDWTVGGITTVGMFGLRLETLNNGTTTSIATLSQSLALNPLDTYTLSFYLGSTGGTSNSFSASLGGDTLFDQRISRPLFSTTLRLLILISATSSSLSLRSVVTACSSSACRTILDISGWRTFPLVKDSIAVTPEPGSLVLIGLGLLMFAVMRWRTSGIGKA